jgi:hypothetical protein
LKILSNSCCPGCCSTALGMLAITPEEVRGRGFGWLPLCNRDEALELG